MTTEATKALEDKTDAYLESVVADWREDNKVAIEAGLKVEVAESLISNLKSILEDHNIEVDAESVDVFEELTTSNDELSNSLNEAKDSITELNTEINEMKAEIEKRIFVEVSKDLAESQVEKLKGLVESIEYVSDEDYTEKLNVVKESFVETSKSSNGDSVTKTLEEEVLSGDNVDDEDDESEIHPDVKAILDFMKNKS